MSLMIKNISFHYARGKDVFTDLSFQLEKGTILSILGTNGAGKSTLLNCIAGVFLPQKGEIILDGKTYSAMTRREIAQKIGYVPQMQTASYAYSVLDYVVMGRTPYISTFSHPSKEDYRMAQEALERMNILHLREKPVTEISGGEKQQAAIARVLTQQPDFILMDEPTAFLDYGNQYRTIHLIQELAEEGYGVIMTTHNPDHAICLDGYSAVLSEEGSLLSGRTADILNENSLSELYHMHIKTSYDEDARRKICIVLLP